MLPDKISKFKVRLDSRRSKESNHSKYLHSSRRRYLVNSIPLLSIVALLVGIVGLVVNTEECSATTSASLELSTNKLSGSTVENGTAIASTNVKVVVSDALDYSLILKVDNTNLTNSSVNSTSSNGGTTITAGNVVDDNTWGYKWDTETSYTAPSTSGTTLANSTILPLDSNGAISFTKTLTFGAKFGSNATAGTYSTSGTLSLVATPATTTYTITYNANGGSGVPSSTPCTVQGVAGSSCTTTLSSTKPTRTNYTFLGWSTSSSASTASYSAGGGISISKDTQLYAVWEDARTINNITYMQDMTSDICTNTSTGATKTLTDDRTYPSGVSNTYTIRKMEDGKCWMTQNLRLTGSSLASSNSNVSTSYTIPTSNISSFDATSTTQAAYYHSATDTAYYTWCAATAGTCESFTSNGANSTYNICPKGWTLPTGGTGTSTDFRNLFTNMGLSITSSLQTTTNSVNWGTGDLAIIQGSKYNFAYTGRANSGSLENTTTDGYWWSRTASGSGAYYLYIGSSRVAPGTDWNRHYFGFAVRCIAN